MMQFFQNAGLSIVWAALGVVLLFIATLAFDMLHPMRLRQMIEEGNVAAGIILGAVVIGTALIISAAIN
jgi:uncharacterized membrane protein YjfL (UPF0719 family)